MLEDLSSANIKRTIEYFEERIVESKVENAVMIMESGEVYHCSGGLNGIALKYFEELGEKLNGATVTHNHPIGSDNEYSFSNEDFSLFLDFKLAVLRGVDEKFIYELNRNAEDIDFDATNMSELAELNHNIIKDAHKRV